MIEIKITGIQPIYERLKTISNNSDEIITKGLIVLATYLQGKITLEAPRRRGNLAKSFQVEYSDKKASVYSSLKYGEYVHEGTGIYGKYGQPIVPRTKQVLATRANYAPSWGKPNKSGYVIFGKSVKGQRANPFAERAVRANQDEAVNKFALAIQRELTKI